MKKTLKEQKIDWQKILYIGLKVINYDLSRCIIKFLINYSEVIEPLSVFMNDSYEFFCRLYFMRILDSTLFIKEMIKKKRGTWI